MAGEIITLPLKLGVRAASLLLRGGEALATRALSFALRASGVARSQSDDVSIDLEQAVSRAQSVAIETDEPQVAEPIETEEPLVSEIVDVEEVVEVDEPRHVSEEPELAGEFAEPGAEEGAGAQLNIDEPWPGYAGMTAKDILARVGEASQAELAAIDLYERAHSGRQTVLAAVERQLALTSRHGE